MNEVEDFYQQTREYWKLLAESEIPKRQKEGLMYFLDALGNIDTPEKLAIFLNLIMP